MQTGCFYAFHLWLYILYDTTNAAGMTDKIQSIESLSTISSLMSQVEGGWVPDFGSRYFTEDFPFGLRTLYELAINKNVECPNINNVYKWGLSLISNYS